MVAALRASEEAYHAVVDHSIQGLAILRQGRIVFLNPALAKDLCWSIEEILALNADQVKELIYAPDLEQTIFYIETCIDQREGQHFEVRVHRKDRSLVWFDVFANCLDFQGERAVQLALINTTGRKNAELALQQERDFALAILGTVNSPVLVLDCTGRIARCNPACEQTFGLTHEEIKDQYFWDLLTGMDNLEVVKVSFFSLIETRTTVRRESRIRIKNGKEMWVSWSNSFLLDRDGEVQFVVGAGIDVTDRIQRERQQQVIADLSSDLRGFLSRQQTFQVILKHVMRFMRVDLAAISLFKPDRKQVVVEAALGTYANEIVGWSIPEGQGVSGQVVQTNQAYMTNDLANDPRVMRPIGFESFTSAAWVPLAAEGRTIGMFMVCSQTCLDENEYRLLISIADIAAGAIHRCLLSEETQRRLQRLTALHTINITVSASLDVRVTLNVLVNQITTQAGVDAADILLMDPVTHNLVFAAGHGFRSDGQDKVRLWIGEGLTGQVALKRKGLHLHNPAGIAAEFAPARQFAAEEFVACHAVPLMVRGEILGVLETFHRAPYEPDSEWQQFLEALATETAIAINNAELLEKLQHNNLDLALAYDATIEGWALALEMRDRVTEGHTRRVAEWTMHLSKALRVGSDELIHIRRGALLHDIGKMGIPDCILNKPGPLTEEEWAIMRKHPQFAYDMLASIPFLRPALAIPYSHHERWDGSGYPQGLKGKQIPLAARIFAVVDVWDALCFGRHYREAMPEEEVIGYLHNEAGRLLDPDAVAAFVEVRRLANLAK